MFASYLTWQLEITHHINIQPRSFAVHFCFVRASKQKTRRIHLRPSKLLRSAIRTSVAQIHATRTTTCAAKRSKPSSQETTRCELLATQFLTLQAQFRIYLLR